MNEIVFELVQRLEPDMREFYEERAAIVEVDGGLPREEAESFALLDVLRVHPWALTGVAVVQFELGGESCWLLTTADGRWDRLTRPGSRAEYVENPAAIVQERFQGAALLCKWPERDEQEFRDGLDPV
jgi:hypothetical protein